MKFLDKLGLALFSILILILSILVCLITFGWVDISIITVVLASAISSQNGMYVTLGVSILIALLAIKCLFFPSWDKHGGKSDDSEGILLQNESGKLLITKTTINNLVVGVIEEFKEIEGAESEVEIDSNNEVYINLSVNVKKGTIIKDISSKLQNDIKSSIKNATDLEIKAINIKVNDTTKEEVYAKGTKANSEDKTKQ